MPYARRVNDNVEPLLVRPALSEELAEAAEQRQHREISCGMSKVMVSLPEELLTRIDEEARRRTMSRSALLAEAAERALARRDTQAMAEAIARSEARFASAGSFEAADVVRAERDAR